MTWWFSNTRTVEEVLGGNDFRVKISSKIVDAALFQKFLCLLFHEAFIG